MLKRFLSILMISMCFVSLANAKWQGREPCSGKKGGVKACTADGKFMCKNGTLSASKKKCTKV
ncbi:MULTISPECIES: hypothetical protein [Acinetobacter calcoaceticus/baumannii complex]|uniref:Uncharacterized protein n=1 Tax=Acinetobacter baumannii TaxID=470 RepID=A0A6I4IEY2_ACIBA|nr:MULTISPECIES: hypothetical protein [Acinetobacter calcoaceticus/baumannii complex]EHU1747768.1 hypothetical protein [Acinetobacter baumannii]EHU1800850.1 hypothetical protein [Acinetobacter baumannii]EHU1952090.1 hypothetical protein [Acinetobacter baumannii]EKU6713968.1 hypothetical protein [Acinetobacter baumannii]EKV1990738.1 hypothetical protein [Acinetobacter baumannii]